MPSRRTTSAEIINHDVGAIAWGRVVGDLGKALYFSAVTMATLGYGDYLPATPLARFLAGAEAFIGVLLAAMMIVTMQRRYVGR